MENQQHNPNNHLKRQLTNRHIQFIAIGGAIGTGLFMGSGKTIHLAGPSILAIYMLVGVVLFFVMRAMGELLLSNLQYKSFTDFSADLLGPWAGFFTGWTYWFCWIVTGTADVIAVASYVNFWFVDLSPWLISCACIALLLIFNLTAVKLFGELEFWFTMIKVIAIIALIVVGLLLITGYLQPNIPHAKPSISNLWNDHGWFPHGLAGFFAGFQIAVFAFVGIELVGTTAAETKNPEQVLPKAINAIPFRIIMFYVLALLVIMIITPWRQITVEQSPFVSLFVLIGFPIAAAVINFVVLTSAASSANSGIYSTGRMLFALAQQREAPRLFARLSKQFVPAQAAIFSCTCLLLGSSLVHFYPNIITAFTVVTSVATILFIFIWSMILCSYWCYRKKYPQRHQASYFKMPLGRLMTIICLLFFQFVLALLTLQTDTRQALFVTPLWFVILWVAYRYQQRKNNLAYSTTAN